MSSVAAASPGPDPATRAPGSSRLVLALVVLCVLGLAGCGGSTTPSRDSSGLTAYAADRHVKAVKQEIEGRLPPGGRLKPSTLGGEEKPRVTGSSCSDPVDTSPHAPSQYNYFYDVADVPSSRFPGVARRIADHFTASGWVVEDKQTRPALSWDLRSAEEYLMSIIVSPQGDLLGIELSTPCVPKVEETFEP